jgi:hypothetical protein
MNTTHPTPSRNPWQLPNGQAQGRESPSQPPTDHGPNQEVCGPVRTPAPLTPSPENWMYLRTRIKYDSVTNCLLKCCGTVVLANMESHSWDIRTRQIVFSLDTQPGFLLLFWLICPCCGWVLKVVHGEKKKESCLCCRNGACSFQNHSRACAGLGAELQQLSSVRPPEPSLAAPRHAVPSLAFSSLLHSASSSLYHNWGDTQWGDISEFIN